MQYRVLRISSMQSKVLCSKVITLSVVDSVFKAMSKSSIRCHQFSLHLSSSLKTYLRSFEGSAFWIFLIRKPHCNAKIEIQVILVSFWHHSCSSNCWSLGYERSHHCPNSFVFYGAVLPPSLVILFFPWCAPITPQKIP